MHCDEACEAQSTTAARIAYLHVPKTSGTALERTLLHTPVNFTLMHDESDDFVPEDFDLFIISARDPSARLISAFNFNDPFEDGNCIAQGKANDDTCGEYARTLYQDCNPPPDPTTTGAAYASADSFAISLGVTDPCGKTARTCVHNDTVVCGSNRHLARGLDWYTSSVRGGTMTVIDRVRAGRARAFLVRTESYEDDVAALWDWLCVPADLGAEAKRRGDSETEWTTHNTERHGMSKPRKNDTLISDEGQHALEQHTAEERQALTALEELAENGRRRVEVPLMSTGPSRKPTKSTVLQPSVLAPAPDVGEDVTGQSQVKATGESHPYRRLKYLNHPVFIANASDFVRSRRAANSLPSTAAHCTRHRSPDLHPRTFRCAPGVTSRCPRRRQHVAADKTVYWQRVAVSHQPRDLAATGLRLARRVACLLSAARREQGRASSTLGRG
jgi:hypothetical protein